ncbi:MarR family winged helix-turn-helix transcriptional regulator [Poseidonibacter ostreae]|jgi:MarR family transcriptional regulator, organic hydroperoxide resistance regulator|nr:MarR family transcriptional regulator [Poseidonibacter ostreae]KAB7884199.1 MarR family transcriptional regulator [Poseidonibacter ostreae]KAB7884500.1 MarR family transcriptional regulator [Poseidonibacter ostreae]|tara:strand:- start:9447 stop:9878 length:432 start_codon:yes stop_codon:yes gene_type:complete
MQNINAIISTISKIHNGANKLIIEELKKNNLNGLAPSHGDILIKLYNCESAVSMREISECINKDKSTITALVNKLEKLELVKKLKSNTDNRSTLICLTKKGLDTKPIVLDKISTKLLEQSYKGFTKKEKEDLCLLLEKMKDNF